MVFIAPGGDFHEFRNASHWLDQKKLHFTARCAQRIPNGRPRSCVWLCTKSPYKRQQVGSTYYCSDGGALPTPYTIRKGSTPTGTAPTRRNRTSQNAQSGQFNITPNVIMKWEGTGFLRVYNMEEVRHPQTQCDTCFQRDGIIHPNLGTRKDSDI